MDTALLTTLSDRFHRFAQADGRDDALYSALARVIADSPELTELLRAAAPTQRLPVLLLAALHERVLAGTDHPLRDYYASVGGDRAPDAALADHLLDFTRRERDALDAIVSMRTTQTNEIGRCAVLAPMLQTLAARRGADPGKPLPVALFDFGCSAGLTLGVDRYRYIYGAGAPVGADEADAPEVRSQWRVAAPAGWPAPSAWRVTARAGTDLAPVDPADDAATRWLRACVWPGDAARRRRLDQALALAKRHPAPLFASEDGLSVLDRWLGTLPADAQPVLVNSWVLAYLSPDERAAYRERVGAWVRDRGLAWISAEVGALAPLAAPPACPDGESPGSATLWTLQWQDGMTTRTEALAWSHPHGRWIEWLDRA